LSVSSLLHAIISCLEALYHRLCQLTLTGREVKKVLLAGHDKVVVGDEEQPTVLEK